MYLFIHLYIHNISLFLSIYMRSYMWESYGSYPQLELLTSKRLPCKPSFLGPHGCSAYLLCLGECLAEIAIHKECTRITRSQYHGHDVAGTILRIVPSFRHRFEAETLALLVHARAQSVSAGPCSIGKPSD